MKKLLYRFLIVCAGSDDDVLKECPRSEHIKHAGFGALVLVPALLAFFSMTYAISTFVENRYLYVLAGISWSVIVFVFDRFVVSSFRKKDTILQDARSFAFISRLIFSVFVGIVVAHPLVLLYFKDSIAVNMDEFAHSKIDSIEVAYKIQKDNYQLRIDTLNKSELAIRGEIKSWEGIVHEEVISSVRNEARGVSGIPGHGPTYRDDTATIARLYRHLDETIQVNARKKTEDSLQIMKLDSIRNQKINRLTFSRDYLEREKALARLSDSNPVIRFTTWFLILFFIFVDVLPVTWKALTKKGPYDDKLNLIEKLISNDTREKEIDSDTKLTIHTHNMDWESKNHEREKIEEEESVV